MNCPSCDEVMHTSVGLHHYTECGLPYVFLDGIEVSRCGACGERAFSIPRMEQLHQVLARAVATKLSRLIPQEVRFLRTHLGYSGKEFAEYMGVDPATVSRWEKGHDRISVVAERLLRLLALTQPPELDLRELSKDEPEPIPRLDLRSSPRGWRPAAAA